jgi:hypothetical protein
MILLNNGGERADRKPLRLREVLEIKENIQRLPSFSRRHYER